MELKNYNIRSASFQPEDAHKYELSILTGMDSFAYTIRDRARNELLAYHNIRFSEAEQEDLPATINRLITADELLSDTTYGSVVLGWVTDRMALVPRELYNADHRRDYLEQLTLTGLDDAVVEEWYNDLGAHLIFAANASLLESVSGRLGAQRAQHPGGGLLTVWGARSRRLEESSVSAAIRGNHLFIAAHRAGALQFFNSFEFEGAQDALYFILLAYEHCGMLPDRSPLYLSGEVTERGEIYKLVYTYVREVRFSHFTATPKPAAELVNIPPHVYFDLLCLG